MAALVCAGCGDAVPLSRDHYECGGRCGERFALCAVCHEDDDADAPGAAHPHPLRFVRGRLVAQALLTRRDAASSHSVVLTNCAGVLPRSPLFAASSVRAVLTLLDAPSSDDDDDDDGNRLQPEQTALRDYAYAGGTVRSSVRAGVVYHWTPLADVSDPRMLRDTLDDTVAEACSFVTHALEHGNDVAVHCYLGMRRSPTMLAAWMVTRAGTTVDAALKAIGSEHADAHGWESEFRRLRPGWVEFLHRWRMSWRVEMERWQAENSKLVSRWDELFEQARKPDSSAAPAAFAKEVEDDEGKEESSPRAKRKCQRSSAMRILDDDEEEVVVSAPPKQQPDQQPTPQPTQPKPKQVPKGQRSIASFFAPKSN